MEDKYRKTEITVSLIKYHFVFCPRYRRKIFLDKEVEKKFKELVNSICLDLAIEVISIECYEDVTHMLLNCLPDKSPLEIMSKIKIITSRELKNEFKHLEKMTTVWTKKFFVSIEENICNEVIETYVKEQRKVY